MPLKPTACRRCGTTLAGEDPQPRRHPVWELPEIKPLVTEYQQHRLSCPCCGDTTCAPLPAGVPTGQSGPRLIGLCGELHSHRDWLWMFLEVAGVEPTNKAAERALRPAVIWRKLSFGTHSAAGSRFVETLLTIVTTCRQQDRNVIAYLTSAVEAHLHVQPAPSLVPKA